MFPTQRIKGTSGAETLGLFAAIGALALLLLAVFQVSTEGAVTMEHAAWWVRFGFAEALCAVLLATAWRLRRRSRA